jgi:hypothetical protein
MSSAGLKVSHWELTVVAEAMAVIRAGSMAAWMIDS